jgi:ABC-2 type transport system ATP-binding protein
VPDHPAIEVRDLRKTYPGGVEAVDGIDFQVAAGEAFGLLGPNGAGKTTLLKAISGSVRGTAGRIEKFKNKFASAGYASLKRGKKPAEAAAES